MSKLIQRGNIGVQKAENGFFGKLMSFGRWLTGQKWFGWLVGAGCAYAISDNVMRHGYDATADIPHMNFKLTKK